MELAQKLLNNSARHSLTREILSSREIVAITNKHA